MGQAGSVGRREMSIGKFSRPSFLFLIANFNSFEKNNKNSLGVKT